MTSRFLQKVAPPISRFLQRHPPAEALAKVGHRIQRIVRKLPIVTKFMAFFIPDELRLDPPIVAPAEADTPHIAPVYNARARKPKGLTLG